MDLRVEAVPEFSTHWGVGLSVVTSDNYLVFSRRGRTAVGAHTFYPSVAESADRVADSDSAGAPKHFNIARRGVEEELGIPLLPKELTWLSFGANSVLCEFALIGVVHTSSTFDEIVKLRESAKDKWESEALHAVKFSPCDVAEFLSQKNNRFSPFAIIAVFETLIHEFGLIDTEAAFIDADVSVTQQLPEWMTDNFLASKLREF